jgi:quercetin dioxygenase-like cupin family protein
VGWIWKDAEEVDPALSVCDREDLLYVIRGSLRLELEGREPVVLAAGEAFVIPPGTRYRGYRWPRDGEPCQFLAVSTADAAFVES